MGTPAFAARSLQKLIDEGYEIPLVVTQPDRKGNRNKMVLSEVRKLALEHGIETAQPVRIKKDPGRGIYWIITSNSLEYMKDGEITNVTSFPYNNNFHSERVCSSSSVMLSLV